MGSEKFAVGDFGQASNNFVAIILESAKADHTRETTTPYGSLAR